MGTTGYGPRVIGEAEFKRQQEAEKKKTNIYGPKVTGEQPGATETVDATKAMSVKDLTAALEANPQLVDEFLKVEKANDPPRVTALRAMQKAEMERPGGPRQAVLDEIASLMGDEAKTAPEAPEV